jgi:hypothetical protein
MGMSLIILRHDVDDAFSTRNLFSTGLNYLRMKIGRRFPMWESLGYLEDALCLSERDRSMGIHSSWFFRTVTNPSSDFMQGLLGDGHEIGFHADRIEDEFCFNDDFEYVAGDLEFLGFTKHGSKGLPTPLGAASGLGEVYNPKLCVKRAKDHGMVYFCGNDVVPTDAIRVVESVVFFPSAFWVFPGYMNDQKFTVDWLIDYQKDHDVVVLVHPSDATELFPKAARNVDKIYNRCDEIVSFKEYLQSKKVV